MAPLIVDLFSGPRGWSEGLRQIGLTDHGIEVCPYACRTATAAGHATTRADVTTLDPHTFAPAIGLIASPPCQTFSTAGLGEGREHVAHLAQLAATGTWTEPATDPDSLFPAATKTDLVLEPIRWITALAPEWVALEQVPAVLPIWQGYAHWLDQLGYSTWCGLLRAEQYGVPQTRTRAVLIASRARAVAEPAPTHQRYRHGEPRWTEPRDGVLPWVSMADALGWSIDLRLGFPRLDDTGTSIDGYRDRDWRDSTEPAFTLTEKARSWVLSERQARGATRHADEPAMTIYAAADNGNFRSLNTGRDWPEGGTRADAQTIPGDRPAPTLTAKSGGQWQWTIDRPATTVLGDSRLWPPGHKINADDRARLGDEATERYGDRAGTDAIRLTVTEALILQSFRPDYPVAGTKSKQFEQIGNAVPPLLARHVLAMATGSDSDG